MSELYTPEISNFKEGKILKADRIGNKKYMVTIEVIPTGLGDVVSVKDTWGPKYSVRKNNETVGKFGDLPDEESVLDQEPQIIQDFWDNIYEPRALP